jgi:hypothetical protein
VVLPWEPHTPQTGSKESTESGISRCPGRLRNLAPGSRSARALHRHHS